MRIQKREHDKRALKYIAKGILTAAGMAVMVWCMPIVSLADTTGKVIPNSVNIRKSPDVNSEKVGSSTVGKTVTIKGKVSVSGTTWYQVYVNADQVGYVRADMLDPESEADIPVVNVSEGTSSDASAGDASSEGTQADNSSAGVQAADESVDLQYATVKVNCKVRPEPSTKKNSVGGLTEGTQVIVSGKSAGSDGRTWYYVTYTSSNGSEKMGFVREDLLEMGELLPMAEETPQEEVPVQEPEPEPVESRDYELLLEQREDGPVWYLYDHINNEQRELVPLLQSAYSRSQAEEEATAAVVKQRIVIVVLIVLLVLLIVTVVIMAFKLRDAYYEEYDDDEEEEGEEEEESPARRRTRDEEPVIEKTARRREAEPAGERRRNGERGERSERRSSRERLYEEEPAQERPVSAAPKRKSKNFLLDDDEFEFEFLNMDDKDLM